MSYGFNPFTGTFDALGSAVPLTRSITLTGTTNQVNVSGGTQDLSADRTWTFSTPQNIHTGASPAFAGLTLSGLTAGEVVYTGTGGLLSANSTFLYDGVSVALGTTINNNIALNVMNTQSTNVSGEGILATNNVNGGISGQFPKGGHFQMTTNTSSAVSYVAGIFGGTTDTSGNTNLQAEGYGLDFGITSFSTNATGGLISGARIAATAGANAGGGTIQTMKALDARIITNSGTVSTVNDAFGLDVTAFFQGTGTTFRMHGINLRPNNTGGGSPTILNYYGVHFNGDFGGATNSYGIYFDANTRNNANGIWWNTDTVIYSSAAATLNLTGAFIASSTVTGTSGIFATATTTPLVAPASGALVVRGLNGTAPTAATFQGGDASNLAATAGAAVTLRGGNAAGSIGSAAGGGVTIKAGSVVGAGTPASVTVFRTNGTTKTLEANDTGLGFFAATPAAQQSGDIGTGLVSLGLFSSTSNAVASGRQTAQTAADANVVTYAVPAADHSYLITSNVLVTTSTLHSFTTTCSYTDESNTARVLTLNYSQLTGAFITAITNGTGASAYEGVPVQIRCKASTNIVIATTGTFTGVTYNIESAIIQVT